MIDQKLNEIPRILHSRSQLYFNRLVFDGGAQCIYVSGDTYPELFNRVFPDVVDLAPYGWKEKGNQKYLWFPADVLIEHNVEKSKIGLTALEDMFCWASTKKRLEVNLTTKQTFAWRCPLTKIVREMKIVPRLVKPNIN